MTIQTNRMVPINGRMTQTAIQNRYGHYWNNIYKIVMGLHEVRARVGTFNTPWNAPSSEFTIMPPLTVINDNLYDLMDARALEISEIAKSTKKRIIVQWSGGIDSTAVLVAFIKNLSTQDLSNVTVALTTNSILENLSFYERFILDKMHYVSYANIVVSEEFLSKNILIHGDPGDSIFGPSISMYADLIADGRHLAPFKDNIHTIASQLERSPSVEKFNAHGFGDWYANKISDNLLEVAPEGVDTIADWWWWHYFNFKWEFSIARPLFRQKPDKEPISTTAYKFMADNTFFASDKFQQWSYSNLKNHIGKDASTHKREIKQYIFQFDKNEQYLLHKRKVESVTLPLDIRIKNINGYYDENWVLHRVNEGTVGREILERLESYKG
jgi:hypothetical protein